MRRLLSVLLLLLGVFPCGDVQADPDLQKLTAPAGFAPIGNDQFVLMIGCRYSTAPVSAADGAPQMLNCTPTGLVKVDGSGVTQPVSGTVTAAKVTVASSTPQACTSVSTTTTVLASNTSRKFASITAPEANTALVYFRLAASAVSTDVPLSPGQSFVLDGTAIYTGVIDAVAEAGTQTVCGLEY